MLVNPNGILFGKDSQVDVNGLIATTRDIDNRNFLKGLYLFQQAPNSDSTIINRINESNAEKTIFGFRASAEVINLQPSSPLPNDPTDGGAFIVDPPGLLGPQDGPFSTIGLP